MKRRARFNSLAGIAGSVKPFAFSADIKRALFDCIAGKLYAGADVPFLEKLTRAAETYLHLVDMSESTPSAEYLDTERSEIGRYAKGLANTLRGRHYVNDRLILQGYFIAHGNAQDEAVLDRLAADLDALAAACDVLVDDEKQVKRGRPTVDERLVEHVGIPVAQAICDHSAYSLRGGNSKLVQVLNIILPELGVSESCAVSCARVSAARVHS